MAYSVRCEMYPDPKGPRGEVTGPEDATVEGALLAFVQKVVMVDLSRKLVLRPVLLERVKGVHYVVEKPDLKTRLAQLGLSL